MSGPRVLVWVQHLLGTGHLRRARLLAEALAARGAQVLLASGGPALPWPVPAGVELLQLPAIRAADSRFSGLVGETGAPVDEALWARRWALLAAAVERLRPQLLVSEHYPFGRGAFARELEPLLRRCAEFGTAAAASVRDLLVSKPDPAKHRAMLARARAFRRVLVHGDPALLPFAASFPLADALGDRLVHTGYLAPPAPPPGPRGPDVLVSAGGGAVGRALRTAAVAAAALLPGRPWRIVAGPEASEEEMRTLGAAAGPSVRIERQRPDLARLIARAAVSVSQAGYNTVVEALAGETPMVLVPFAEGGEDEQTRRAAALAARGRARLLPESELSPARLAAAVEAALADPPPGPAPVRLDGAERAAELLLALVDGGRAG